MTEQHPEPETGLSPADAAFAREHAAAYVGADRHPEQAAAYSDWYARTYLPGADDLGDLPSHQHAWLAFLDAERQAEQAAEAGS